ncbi:baseplate J/gp47 family protein [Paraburkholderia sediminicola]|uniref:baseplate J/gp47 family protein n=1 Tax=Paraburkholderia sediminicola TaxID=458836 RepID=UPI0038BA6609
MAFQLKNFASIANSMINRMKATQSQITDFNVGAVARTLVEAPAAEIDELYQQMFNGLQEAIPVAVFNSFNFPPLAAQAASGLAQVSIASQPTAVLVSAGTTFTPNGASSNVYQSAADVVIPAGSTTVNIQVACTVAGSAGNLPQNQVFAVSPQPTGFVSASNANAFVNGNNAETPAEQLIRFNNYISTLARGTPAALSYGLSTVNLTDVNGNITEKVALSLIVEPYLTDSTQPPALVNCYIHNGVGNTSNALLSQAQNVIAGYVNSAGTKVPGYKAAGVKTNVNIATEVDLAVSATVTIASGYAWANVQPLVEAAIFSYLQGLGIGNSGSNVAGTDPVGTAVAAQISKAAMNIPGVTNYVSTFTDALAVTGTKIMPGSITLTQGT